MIDSLLSILGPLAEMMIFESQTNNKNVDGWQIFIHLAKIIRNQIDLVTGLSFLILAYTVGRKLLQTEEESVRNNKNSNTTTQQVFSKNLSPNPSLSIKEKMGTGDSYSTKQ